MEYLKEEQYYVDLYDLFTVEQCLDTLKMFGKIKQEADNSKDFDNLTDDEKQRHFNYTFNTYLLNQEI